MSCSYDTVFAHLIRFKMKQAGRVHRRPQVDKYLYKQMVVKDCFTLERVGGHMKQKGVLHRFPIHP
jgi:hypothetical protein